MKNQQGRTVVITGSSRGLGFEMAQRFRKYGFNVVINGISSERLEKARLELEAITAEGEVLAILGDVSNGADLQIIVDKALERFGCIDIWINNAA